MSNNLFNFLDNKLNKEDSSLFSKLKNTFINELQDYLEKCHSYNLFKQLPKTTYLHLTGYNGNFLECMAYEEKKIYYVPKNILVGESARNSEML